MSTNYPPLEFGRYYHIYNRGINSCEIFKKPDNFLFFLQQYDKFVSPVADTLAWVLMGNHFHLLVRIKEEKEIPTLNEIKINEEILSLKNNASSINNGAYLEYSSKQKSRMPDPSRQFGHLLNSYAQAFNKSTQRHGNLFERPFKRKMIESDEYLLQVILYIHNNPVYHGFCSTPEDYRWSSYQTCLSSKPTKLKRNEVIDWFGDIENFKAAHRKEIDIFNLEKWLEI